MRDLPFLCLGALVGWILRSLRAPEQGRAPLSVEVRDGIPIVSEGDTMILSSTYRVMEDGELEEIDGSVWVERTDGTLSHYPAGL